MEPPVLCSLIRKGTYIILPGKRSMISEAYVESNRITMALTIFTEKAPSQMFDCVLNAPLDMFYVSIFEVSLESVFSAASQRIREDFSNVFVKIS